MYLRLCLLLLVLLSSNLLAAEQLEVRCDYSVFYNAGVEPDNYIELYFTFPANSYTMKYNEADSIYSGNIILEFRVDSVGKEILTEKWDNPLSIRQSQLGNFPQDFYGLKRFFLYSGEYMGTLLVLDVNGNRKYETKFPIIVKKIEQNKLGLSSLQIANNIIPKSKATDNESELFYKNQHYVYPNPLKEISADLLTLHIYNEVYNAAKINTDTIEIKYEIRNPKGDIEAEYSRYKYSFSDAMVETISYPIDILPTNIYTLTVKVIGNNKITRDKDTAISKTSFYVINNNIELGERRYYTEDEQFDLSEFATMSEDKINLEFSQFEVLATKDEIVLWKKLSELKAKQRFLFKFWYMRNTEIGNSFNVKLFEYRERLKYVNTYYSYAGKENGWNTDRGKIYIKFGKPDHKEEVPGNPTQHPYQIWTYHSIEGGATFAFVDMLGLENYRLVHSSHSGYLHNTNWQNMINKNYYKSD